VIKVIVFDLDGVLVKTKDIHFMVLNEALKNYKAKKIITVNEHQTIYDGLPTKKKLEILNKEKNVISKNASVGVHY
jgi:beta-phosphoglucomutase-like phosphatase (HAD superfamily)